MSPRKLFWPLSVQVPPPVSDTPPWPLITPEKVPLPLLRVRLLVPSATPPAPVSVWRLVSKFVRPRCRTSLRR
jgi:hypothetical protein